jgi:heme a synthase
MSRRGKERAIVIWLSGVCLLITLMVAIGGITRLTGSGLSITEWAPILGTLPPLNEKDWEIAFGMYKASPQYIQVNSGMELGSFKWIFFWEFIHRLLGRFIGLFVFLPMVGFWMKGLLTRPLFQRVFIGFLFGGLQGALGWFMVKSGLIDRPSVSHFRLAAHLGLALCLLAYFTNLTLRVKAGEFFARPHENLSRTRAPIGFWVFTALFVFQIIFGAFVAGLKAGYGFNTFPLMDGRFFPGNAWALEPTWMNVIENPSLIQWIHRSLGWGLLFSGIYLFWKMVTRSDGREGSLAFKPGSHLAVGIFAQFLLGVATLLSGVAIPLAVVHQFGAACLVILWVRFHFHLTRIPH